MSDFLSPMLDLFLTPFMRLLNPAQRVFYPSIICSLLLLLWFYRGKITKKNILEKCFNKNLWWNASTRHDYLCFLLLPFIMNAIWIPAILHWQIAIISTIEGFLQTNIGIVDTRAWPFWLTSALYSVVIFLALDFSRFLMHVLMHKYKPLWQFHLLHHTATTLNPLTLFRFHPVELFLGRLRDLVVIGIVTGFTYYLFRGNVTGWQLFGTWAIGFGFNFFGSLLRHSVVPFKYPAFLEKMIISPYQHQLHHSLDKEHWDCNFGVALSIWDRMYGSLVLSPKGEYKLAFGVEEDGKVIERHDFLYNMVSPFYFSLRLSVKWLLGLFRIRRKKREPAAHKVKQPRRV